MRELLKRLWGGRKTIRHKIGFVIPTSSKKPAPSTTKEKREHWKFVFAITAAVTGATRFLLKLVGAW